MGASEAEEKKINLLLVVGSFNHVNHGEEAPVAGENETTPSPTHAHVDKPTCG
jgi:hypothetical protein